MGAGLAWPPFTLEMLPALRRLCGSHALRHTAIGPRGDPLALLRARRRLFGFRPAVRGIFLAVDWRHMRRISIQIRPANSKLLSMRIDPFPEGFAGRLSLRARRALDANDIGRKPVAVTATEAAAVVRPGHARGLADAVWQHPGDAAGRRGSASSGHRAADRRDAAPTRVEPRLLTALHRRGRAHGRGRVLYHALVTAGCLSGASSSARDCGLLTAASPMPGGGRPRRGTD